MRNKQLENKNFNGFQNHEILRNKFNVICEISEHWKLQNPAERH